MPTGGDSAAFCFRDLAEVSGAQVKELHSQTWGEDTFCSGPGVWSLAVEAA